MTPLIEYRDIACRFTTRRGSVTATENVDLTVGEGEFLGIVGPGGSSSWQYDTGGMLFAAVGRKEDST